MSEKPIIEICCAGPDDVAAAVSAGASRIELCSVLSAEGVTPSPGLIAEALRIAGDVPLTVLVRPREGDFCYTQREIAVMVADIRSISAMGASGVTIGAMTDKRMPDQEAMGLLIDAAGENMQLTFHRAIDDCAYPLAAIDMLVTMGIDRVLTSGSAATAIDGSATIREMIARGAGRIEIMPGGGVRPDNIAALRLQTGARQFHSSARNKSTVSSNGKSIFGATPATVDANIVRQLIAELS